MDSARALFAKKGFEGASLDEIAENAGFTRGAIYKHFSNKEDLFFAVLEQFNQRALGAFGEMLDSDLDAALDPQTIADTWLQTEISDPELWALSVEFTLYELRNPEVRQRTIEWRRQNRQRVAEFLSKKSAEAGLKLKLPPETMAAILLTTSDGFMQAAWLDADAKDLYATFLELFLPAIIESE